MEEQTKEVVSELHGQIPELNEELLVSALLNYSPTKDDCIYLFTKTISENPIDILETMELKNYGRLVVYVKALIICKEEGKMSIDDIREIIPHIAKQLNVWGTSLNLSIYEKIT